MPVVADFHLDERGDFCFSYLCFFFSFSKVLRLSSAFWSGLDCFCLLTDFHQISHQLVQIQRHHRSLPCGLNHFPLPLLGFVEAVFLALQGPDTSFHLPSLLTSFWSFSAMSQSAFPFGSIPLFLIPAFANFLTPSSDQPPRS